MQAKFAGILIFFLFCLALFDYCCSLFVVLVVVFVGVDLKKKQNYLKTDDMELHAIHGPGARFSKVPKLFGRISGKTGFPELAGRSFTNGFSGPKSFPDFRETGPRPEVNYLRVKNLAGEDAPPTSLPEAVRTRQGHSFSDASCFGVLRIIERKVM